MNIIKTFSELLKCELHESLSRPDKMFSAYCVTKCHHLVCLHSAALEVELSDDSFPPEDFGIVSGMLNVKWDRIAPYPCSKMTSHWHYQT